MDNIANLLSSIRDDENNNYHKDNNHIKSISISHLVSDSSSDSLSTDNSFLKSIIEYWLNNHTNEINSLIETIITKMIYKMFEDNGKKIFDSIFTEKLQEELIIRFYNIAINDGSLRERVLNLIYQHVSPSVIQTVLQESITSYISDKFTK